MKIQLRVAKEATGLVDFEIYILDGEDFPTRYIFADNRDYPAEQTFKLKQKEKPFIWAKFKTREEGMRWAMDQIDTLKEKLMEWRRNEATEKFDFQI